MRHLTTKELEAGLADIERSPRERGVLMQIVRRPSSGERALLDTGVLDVEEGLVGDRWALGKRRRVNQLTLINTRLISLVAQTRERWPLAGDQLFVDFDLSLAHLPAGTFDSLSSSGLHARASAAAAAEGWLDREMVTG